MKLMDVQIRGFRSIDDMTIPLGGNGHKVLVGKNESGKSNILKALQLLSGGFFSKDERKIMLDKKQQASVIFRFELDQHELVECRDSFIGKFIPSGVYLTNHHSIEEFYDKCAKISYRFDIDKQGEWCWEIPDNIQINDGWYYLEEGLPSTHVPTDSYIHDSFIRSLPDDEAKIFRSYLLIAGTKDIYDELHNAIKETLKLQNMPFPCIYWEYNSQYCDLPNTIDMDAFSHNPDSCLSLKRMFLLSGYEESDIGKEILEGRAEGHNSIKSLLDKISLETNKYINKNWQEYNKEYRDVRIKLRDNGNDIVIGIKDSQNIYNFAKRSDGFRRFISFLLLMTDKNNSLILLDEPETGLHPSSAKDLRDVLIKLGKQNIIVYATHSISMIDTENVENNLIIRKENENTLLEVAEEDGISSAELVYRALGFSIYEDLKKKNILLEGYLDKKILKLFMQGNEWKDFGICYTRGVSKMNAALLFLDLMNREYYILSDADENAKRGKKKANLNKNWYTYKDLGSNAITLEDFYKKEFFNGIVKSVLKENGIIIEINMPDNGRLISIKGALEGIEPVNIPHYIEEEIGETEPLDIRKILEDIKEKCAEEATEKEIHTAELKSVLNQFLEKITAKNP